MGLGPKLGGLSSLRTNSPSTNPSAKVGTIFGNARPNPVDRNLFGAESSCLMLRNGYKAMICSSVSPVTGRERGPAAIPHRPLQPRPARRPGPLRPRGIERPGSRGPRPGYGGGLNHFSGSSKPLRKVAIAQAEPPRRARRSAIWRIL
jgi:hypothetical protein